MNLSDCQHFACAYNTYSVLPFIHSVLCLSLQACQDGGGVNVFGIGSVDSAQLGEVTTSGWTFTISYSNSMQNKKCHVTYKRAASGGTQFNFISESPQSTYVRSCSFFSVHLCMYTALLLQIKIYNIY